MQNSSLEHPQSFHPVFHTHVSVPATLDLSGCSLNLHYSLPPLLFVDPYELENRADDYAFEYTGPSNLELPVFALEQENHASLLIRVARSAKTGEIDVQVPLHVRYGPVASALPPSASGSYIHTDVAWPDIFYACPKSSSANDTLPPMARELSPSFDGQSILRVKPVKDAAAFETLRTPVGQAADVRSVVIGTAVVVMVCFFYLASAMWRTAVRSRESTAVGIKEKSD